MEHVSVGRCAFCNVVLGKIVMTKHLKTCEKRKTVSESGQKRGIFHLTVEGRRLPQYWMHLEVPADATFEDLDAFLRRTWLECCGHMSAFTIGETRYVTGSGIDAMWVDVGFVPGGEESMDVRLGEVLRPGIKFYHEYDFGTPTELTLRVLSEREGYATMRRPVRLLARNELPEITCGSCGMTARWICCECKWKGKGWLCDECARRHPCGEDMLLPVVNSPRVGECGYTGED